VLVLRTNTIAAEAAFGTVRRSQTYPISVSCPFGLMYTVWSATFVGVNDDFATGSYNTAFSLKSYKLPHEFSVVIE
jgi:hypothetical protein